MEQNPKFEGKCLFCGKMFAKAGINRHLKSELEKLAESKPKGQSFLVKVETNPHWGATPYFLSLWVDREATLKQIDQFLRDIWLECCGHLSSFGEIDMSKKAGTVFYKDLKLDYEYDFGSSTELQLTVLEEYPVKADTKIVLLSRNEPPEMLCDICKKEPATQICSVCLGEDESIFCDKCSKKHAKKCEDFADYASMPVVNSPRVGVCAYNGGTIDIERDGVFVKK
ncbi:hypothetical protein FACS1894180_1250 [Bacteroidia bacterium]|nr:hypothetical protein FACS1894180_1250 [Bacteroidia bacterium]